MSDPALSSPPATMKPRRPASDLQLKKAPNLTQAWRDDTRKVSQELGKICEEAFNRSSVSSTSGVSHYTTADTPPTSVSTQDGRAGSHLRDRPLPETPVLRELSEKRQKMIDMFSSTKGVDLEQMLAPLDARIAEEIRRQKGSRISIDPSVVPGRRASSLPVQGNTMDDLKHLREETNRAASDPVKTSSQGTEATVRLVPASSPANRLGPVNTRKNKAMPVNSLRDGRVNPTITQLERDGYDTRLYTKKAILDTIEEDPALTPKKKASTSSLSRKWSWLNNKRGASSTEISPLDQIEESRHQNMSSSGVSDTSRGEAVEVRTAEQQDQVTLKKKWFQKMFSKSSKSKGNDSSIHTDHEIAEDISEDGDVNSIDGDYGKKLTNRGSYRAHTSVDAAAAAAVHAPIEISQNWLARFFRIKPATRVMCLQVSKARARKDVIRVLRDWRKYGLRDVVCERRAGGDIIRARVDACNCKFAKESFRDDC
jgi:serine/threonine-protein kinase HSL1, negative regulator of Swe1 kinase